MTDPCERLQMEVDALKNDVALQEKENLRLRRVVQGLEQAARDKYADRPDAKIVTHLLETWQVFCGHERCAIPLDGKRAERVRFWLKTYSAEYLEQVFRAAGEHPYVWGYKRQRHGTSDTRRTQIETLLKDEKTIEGLRSLLDAPLNPTVQIPQAALDKMRFRVKAMEAQVERMRAFADEQFALAQILTERLGEIQDGAPIPLVAAA
jgi:hypothetical protein